MNVTTSLNHTFNSWIASASFSLPGKQKNSSQLSSSYIQADNNESLPEYVYSTTLYWETRETVSSRKRDQDNRSTVHWESMIHRRMLSFFLPNLRIKGLTRRAYNGIWFRVRRTGVEEARKNRIIVSEDNSRPRLSRKKREKSKASCDVQCHDGYQSSTTQSQHSRHPCVPGL